MRLSEDRCARRTASDDCRADVDDSDASVVANNSAAVWASESSATARALDDSDARAVADLGNSVGAGARCRITGVPIPSVTQLIQ